MKQKDKKSDAIYYSKIVNHKSPVNKLNKVQDTRQVFDQYGNFIYPNKFSSDQSNVNSANLFYKN